MTIAYLSANFLTGLSSDTKPTTVPTFSVFVETDNLKAYLFDGASWSPFSASAGNANISTLLGAADITVNPSESDTTTLGAADITVNPSQSVSTIVA